MVFQINKDIMTNPGVAQRWWCSLEFHAVPGAAFWLVVVLDTGEMHSATISSRKAMQNPFRC